MIVLNGHSPASLGLPEKFTKFRREQLEGIEFIANCEKRFAGLAIPTGGGKSLVGLGAALAMGTRTAILTATHGLEKQYTDMGQAGLVDIRGKANYRCREIPGVNCRVGQIEGCSLCVPTEIDEDDPEEIHQGGQCSYEMARNIARRAPLVVTNYAYWLRVNEFGAGLEPPLGRDNRRTHPIELLVLDEAHAAMEQLSQSLKVEMRETWLHAAGYRGKLPIDNVTEWAQFAYQETKQVEEQLKSALQDWRKSRTKAHRDKVHTLDRLIEALKKICGMGQADLWVAELHLGTKYGRLWEFNCVWPGSWSRRLFQMVPRVVLMSATLRATIMNMLGIPTGEMEFREWPRVFPAERTPVYHIPTVRMNHKISDEGLAVWVERIDEIIESRLERKGIIHTVSYHRQRYLLDHSRFARYMHCNDSESESATAVQVVARFQLADPPAILVSPSFSTGWDFPGRRCEWQVIAKVPWPDIRSKVMAARIDRHRSYADNIAMQDLIQACGRATRSVDDRCEIFCVDDGVVYFLQKNRFLKPRWFDIQRVSKVPPPGPRAPEVL